MKIKQIRVRNFKSFDDTGWIDLDPHLTVLVGQNNAGKSAILRALQFDRHENIPHLNENTSARSRLEKSHYDFRFLVPGDELLLHSLRKTELKFPTDKVTGAKIFEILFGQETTIQMFFNPGGTYGLLDGIGHGLTSIGEQITAIASIDEKNKTFRSPRMVISRQGENFAEIVKEIIQENTFVFSAERYNVGRAPITGDTKLRADAGNLPTMLLRMNRDYNKMESYQRLVTEVFPDVRRILISTVAQEVEISVQSHRSHRGDLAVPLNESGTGISQVLALLYVLVDHEHASVSIDEPSSFLHPGATRRLLNILRRFTQHQIVVATHSPDVISILSPGMVHMLRWDEERGATVFRSSSSHDFDFLRDVLSDLGARLSDVFGFDVVVFVEGRTEEVCFPLLLDAHSTGAVSFVAMREASGFNATKPIALFDIYTKGVERSALMPPKTRFSFDREGRKPLEIDDLIRASKGAAAFLPRAMYENYLVHTGALAAMLRGLDVVDVYADMLDSWIEENIVEYSLIRDIEVSRSNCNAAKLLSDIVRIFTQSKYEYKKIEHGLWLTRWLIENDSESLRELTEYITALVGESA